MSLNKNEVGQYIRVNMNENISAATPTLILEPKVGTKLEITSGVTIPAVNVVINGVTLSANQYVEYQTLAGDLDYVGQWRYKVKLAFDDTDIRQTDYQRFTVLA